AKSAAHPAGRTWRILYAEDVRELREIARMTLKPEGHAIECVNDGRAALERLQAAPEAFDVILMDHHMPRMNGLEFVEELRKMKWPGKIIVFSSELRKEVERAYLALHVDLVLPKPIFPSELRKALAEL